MDPYLGPVASALVAAVCAGIMLGLVRLSRVSLEWWRRRGRGASAPPAGDEALAPEDLYDAELVREAREGAFRDANLVLLAAAMAGAVGLAIALDLGFGARPASLPPATPTPGARAIGEALALAPLALLATALAAFLLAFADRGVTALARRVGLTRATAALDVTRWLEAARLLWPGGDEASRRREPPGVGLAYVALFAACTAAWAVLLVALRMPAPSRPPAVLLAPLLLVVPLAYAAAAERSQSHFVARLRQAAAGRQLLAAPAWGMAIAATLPSGTPVSVVVFAILALVLATPLALPGTAVGSAWTSWPNGGDAEEPSVGVRALSAVAHYAWLGAIALAAGLALAGGTVAAFGTALGIAVAVLVLRVLGARGGEGTRRVLAAAALAAGALALAARGTWGAP